LIRDIGGDNAEAFGIRYDLNTKEIIQGCCDEVFDCMGITNRLINLFQVGLNLLRLDGMLGKDTAGGFFTLGCLIHLAGDVDLGFLCFIEFTKIKGQLVLVPFLGNLPVRVNQQRLGDGVDDAL